MSQLRRRLCKVVHVLWEGQLYSHSCMPCFGGLDMHTQHQRIAALVEGAWWAGRILATGVPIPPPQPPHHTP
jgi:hypothetical protein